MLVGLRNSFQSLLRKHPGIPVLLLAWLAIVLTNTEPGTWFLSWDTMASEFNPALNIERSITGAWQSFQGLGLLGGHGYSAPLFHALTQLVLGLFIPLQYLRYAFLYLMLLAGVLGSYALIRQTIEQLKLKQASLGAAATFGSLVYLLHPGTVQTFYVALEPFAVMYGLLPWALWSFAKLLEHRSAKRLILFFLINCYLSIIGFIPPLFITYVLFLGLSTAGAVLTQKNRLQVVKTSAMAALIVLVANAYWLGPVAYFTLNQGSHYLLAKLNQITTTEFIYTTRATGNLSDVALLKGFLFESYDQARFGSGSALESILLPWSQHFKLLPVRLFGYSLAMLSLWGVAWGGVRLKKKRAVNLGHVLAGVLTFSLLLTSTVPFTYLSDVLRHIPILNQAFRIPYSKLSMSASLFLSLWAAVGMAGILEFLPIKRKKVQFLVVCMAMTLLLCLTWPSFQGNFLYRGGRVQLPVEYTQLVEYFAHRPSSERIAQFPIYTYTGWDMHSWSGFDGYTGSGFLWYGIRQPILSRSFDVWSPFNETYRLEMQRAVYNQDAAQLQQLFRKYSIAHIIIDKSVFLPNAEPEVFFASQIQELIEQIPGITKANTGDNLIVYQYAPGIKTFPIQAVTEGVYSRADSVYSRFDPSTATDLTTVTDPTQAGQVYPFANIQRELLPIQAESGELRLTSPVSLRSRYSLSFPQLKPGQAVGQLANFRYNGQELEISFESPLAIQFGQVQMEMPTVPPLTIPLVETPNALNIEVNGQVITLEKNSTKNAFLNRLFFDDELVINYFDPQQATPSADHILVAAEQLRQVVVPASIWDSFQLPSLAVGPNTQTAELVFKHANPENLTLLSAVTQPASCTETSRGTRSKTITNNSVVYESNDGATSCDSFTLPGINNQTPALIRVSGKNYSGRNIRMYIENLATHRVDFEHVMTVPDFDVWATLPEWNQQPVSQYSLHFENRSYGTETARNGVDTIEVYPIPVSFEWLSQITLSPEQNTSFKLPLAVRTIRRWGTGLYMVELNGEEGIIVMNEAANPGWKVYVVQRPTFVSALYSLLRGQKISTPVTVNNWAQGWKIPTGINTVLIVHDAQLLLFAGLWVLLVATFLVAAKTLHFLYAMVR